MARKSKRQRNQEQRERQAAVRAKAKANKKPARDDFARVLLWQMIRAAQRERDPRRKLDLLRDTMTDVLEEQGFDLKEAEDVFEDLAKRYSNGLNPFRPKFQMACPAECDGSFSVSK
jgi:GAF domain-containing protein